MVKVHATAAFTEDMADTLKQYFQVYAEGGIVSVEVTDRGLWLVNPHYHSRQFLGLAALAEQPPIASDATDLAKSSFDKLH